MITAGDWVLIQWGELASWLILAALAAGLVGLIVGYRARARSEQASQAPSDCRTYGAHDTRAEAEAAARDRALDQLAIRYPVAFTHLEDEELAAAGIFRVPSHLLPQAADTTDGGHQ